MKAAYLAVFGLAGVSCLLGIGRAVQLDANSVSRSLTALLLLAGVWALLEFGRLFVSDVVLKQWLYMSGLVVGFSAVFVWLYFISAYTGASYHRNRGVQAAALAVLVSVSALKLSNPIHGLYFTATVLETPFRHMAVEQSWLHWSVTGAVYLAVGVGFYRLFITFEHSGYDTKPLVGLGSLAAVPVLPLVVSNVRPDLVLGLNYEPVGVALFSLGALYLVENSFVSIGEAARRQVIESVPPALIIVGRDGLIVDYDSHAEAMFPSVTRQVGGPVSSVHEGLAEASEGDVIDVVRPDGTEHYTVSCTPVSLGPHEVGEAYVLNDVTTVEDHRRELERQNRQLDEFTEAMSHELRNPLNVVMGELSHVRDLLDDGETGAEARNALARAENASDRMVAVIDDIQQLAAQGKTVDDTAWCRFEALCDGAWGYADRQEVELCVEGDGEVLVNQTRARQLLVASFRYLASGSSRVHAMIEPRRMILVGENHPEPSFDLPALLEQGYGAGADREETVERGAVGLANVRTLAGVHGWSVTAEWYDWGLQIVIDNVQTRGLAERVEREHEEHHSRAVDNRPTGGEDGGIRTD